MPVAIFGITDDTLNMVVSLVLVFLVVVWLALIAWTFFDARRRIDDPVLVACATGASVFPFVGTIVYSILRPPEYLDEQHERELEIRAAELRLRQLEEQSCPNCEQPVERSFLRCPRCRARIKHPCRSCGQPVDPRWTVCPYCEAALRRPQRRPAEAGGQREAQPQRAGAKPRSQPPPEQPEQAEAQPRRRGSEQAEAQPRQRKPAAKQQQQKDRKPAPAKDGSSSRKESGTRQGQGSKQRSSSSRSGRRTSSKQR